MNMICMGFLLFSFKLTEETSKYHTKWFKQRKHIFDFLFFSVFMQKCLTIKLSDYRYAPNDSLIYNILIKQKNKSETNNLVIRYAIVTNHGQRIGGSSWWLQTVAWNDEDMQTCFVLLPNSWYTYNVQMMLPEGMFTSDLRTLSGVHSLPGGNTRRAGPALCSDPGTTHQP